jgi:subtilase family serine protease
MFSFFRKRRNTKAQPASAKRSAGAVIESLETRQLLSAAATATINYDSTFAAASTSTNSGYTPAQIRKAYGFDTISFPGNSSTNANGAGQTIAIVDAFNDPNIVGDLAVFDTAFGLPAPPSFKIVNQAGGSKLPATDSGWAGEISLDVEWAHAIASGANILLVEASSDDTTDLMAAVDYARHASGVSVVSMSWGGSEFFSWGGGESSSQLNYDPIFTTPAGHQGVTFVASAGDSGSFGGVQWPASSPNVLSVGGTSLYTSDSSGTYQSESSWNGTSSGYSEVETEPSYQSAVQSTGARSVADVSYVADPNTGVAVYDSLPDEGYSGWQEVGGTSAGAPQWAALIAIADQGRALLGETSLDGATQTLDMLYSLYSDPTSSGYSSYTSYFNDIIDSTGVFGGDPWHFRWGHGGRNGSTAVAGYDTITGLGSPKAPMIVDALIGTGASGVSSGSSGSTTSGGSNGSTSSSNPTVAALPASPLTATFTSAPAASATEGSTGVLDLLLTNTTSSKFSGPVSVTLYASTDNSLSANDTAIATITLRRINIAADHSRTIKLKFDYSMSLPNGSYDVLASVSATGTNTAPVEADALSTVALAAPAVDLATSFGGQSTIAVNPGHGDTAIVTIENLGNVTATGLLNLLLYASTAPTLDSSAQLLASMTSHMIHIRAGHSITLRLHFTAPVGMPAGSYSLIASSTSATNPSDGNASNNVAAIGTSK